MKQRYFNEAIECAPITDLVEIIEQNLASTDVFVQAEKSPLYQEKWVNAGIHPSMIKSLKDFQTLPFTDSSDLRVTQEKYHPDDFICDGQRPRLWISTSGSTGVPKWVPVGGEDRANNQETGYRLAYFTDKRPNEPGDKAFGVSAPAPFISDTIVWSGFINEILRKGPQDIHRAEGIFFSYEDGLDGASMAIKRKVTIFLAFPSIVMRIAEGIRESIPKLAEQEFHKKKNFLTWLAYRITKIRNFKARDILKVHTGVFAGEPLSPYKGALLDAWNLKYSYNIYSSTEFQISFCECSEQDGVHVWLDACIPEIIPQSELDREQEEEDYTPQAVLLWNAQPGDEGELVLTNFAKMFPLVRWRTSDMIQVVNTDTCSCGRTHPRINILQRSDDLVNLGVIRFSTFVIKDILDGISQPSKIKQWQLRVGREKYKPTLTVIIRPETTCDEGDLIDRVSSGLDQIEMLKTGWENELIYKPRVIIDPDLGDRLSSSGKFRPLVYEDFA